MHNTIKLTQEYLKRTGMDFDLSQIPEEQRIIKRMDMNTNITLDTTDEKTATGYISTISIDSDGDIVMPDGMDMSRFEKNPTVYVNHEVKVEKIIGKAVAISKTDTGILAKTQFADTYLANTVWKLVKGGFAKTFSIGFAPLSFMNKGTVEFNRTVETLKSMHPTIFSDTSKLKRIISKSLMLEYSLVGIPANEDSLVLAVKQMEVGSSEVIEEGKSQIVIIGSVMKHINEIKIDKIRILGRSEIDVINNIQKMIKGRI